MKSCVERFRKDCGRYPTTEEGLPALYVNPSVKGWRGPYVSKLSKDPWGNPYDYDSTQRGFTITSYGADGIPGGKGGAADIVVMELPVFSRWVGAKAPKPKMAEGDIATLRDGLDLFRLHHGRYPTAKEGLAILYRTPRGASQPYLDRKISFDPWGGSYRYTTGRGGYRLSSYGADGKRGGKGENADIEVQE